METNLALFTFGYARWTYHQKCCQFLSHNLLSDNEQILLSCPVVWEPSLHTKYVSALSTVRWWLDSIDLTLLVAPIGNALNYRIPLSNLQAALAVLQRLPAVDKQQRERCIRLRALGLIISLDNFITQPHIFGYAVVQFLGIRKLPGDVKNITHTVIKAILAAKKMPGNVELLHIQEGKVPIVAK
jgi:hypothetical protein